LIAGVGSQAGSGPLSANALPEIAPEGLVALGSVVRVNGPYAEMIRRAAGDAWIAVSYDRAAEASALTAMPIATMTGDVFRGPHLVSGGTPEATRGILETKREIKDLTARIDEERERLLKLAEETAELEAVIAQASTAIATLQTDHHQHEKTMVGLEAQLQRASEDAARIAQKREQLLRERRQAEEERDTLERRQEEAYASIVRLEHDQRRAEELLATPQRP